MIYELFTAWLGAKGSGLLQSIAFRSVMAVLTGFLIALWFGRGVIAHFARLGLAENTGKTDSPRLADLHRDKQGTPTMGGVFIVAGMLVASLLWMRFDWINEYSWLALLLVAWFGTVGFVDDWIKLRVPDRQGLSKRTKQMALTLGALTVGWCLHHVAGLESRIGGPHLHAPFAREAWSLAWWGGVPFLLVCVVVLTGAANAVNLTDGLDGLAVGCVAIASLAYACIAYFVGRVDVSAYLGVAHVPGSGELTVMMGALLGASLAFLWYNAPPAQIFMGDVGSLALGGALGYVALVSRTELVLFVVGGVFVAETLSVIVQVASFKSRGRRVFRCAPLHHHFQFGGMPESRLVVRMWIVAALLALASLALFRIR